MKDDYQYNNKLINYEREIESLNQKISELETTNRNLNIKILELTKNKHYLIQMENTIIKKKAGFYKII